MPLGYPEFFLYNWLTYTYVQMSKYQARPCNETRGIIVVCKIWDIQKVMIHGKFQSSKPFWFKHKDF